MAIISPQSEQLHLTSNHWTWKSCLAIRDPVIKRWGFGSQ